MRCTWHLPQAASQWIFASTLLSCMVSSCLAESPLIDFDGLADLNWTSASGSILVITNFDPLDSDLELQVSQTIPAGYFVQFAVANGPAREFGVIEEFFANTNLSFGYCTRASDNPASSRLQLTVNTDAWGDGGGNYRGKVYVSLPARTQTRGTLSWDYALDAAFMQALTNWHNGQGTYFQFFLDNSGVGNPGSAVTFAVDDFVLKGPMAVPVTHAPRWAPLCEPATGGWITSLAVSPYDRNRILMGGDMLGIGLSLDGGETWQSTYGLRSYEIADFTWHPADSNIVWAGTMGGLYRSKDGGRNWQPVRMGFPAPNPYYYSTPIQKVLFDPNNQQHLLAFGGNHREMETSGDFGAVWESTTGGSSWIRLGAVKETNNVMAAAFGGGSSTRLYAAVLEYGVCVSDDGGRTWQLRTNGLPCGNAKDLVASPTDPNTAYVTLWNYFQAGSYRSGGIWWTTNAGADWYPRNNGIRQNSGTNPDFVSKFKAVALAPTNPLRLATSDFAYDNTGVYVSSDDGASWIKHPAGSTAMLGGGNFTGIAFSPFDSDTVFVFGSEYLLRSTNGGVSWTDLSSFATHGGFRGRGYAGWVTTHFRWHPTDPNRSIFTGMDHGFAWQSRDSLTTWTWPAGLPAWGAAQDVTWATNDTVYLSQGEFGSPSSVARSKDGGRTYTMLSGSSIGLPDSGQPRGIYTRPDDSSQVWVAWNGLRRSTNGGDSWTLVAGVNGPLWIAADPRQPGRLYVTGEEGVYATEDGAAFTLLANSPTAPTRLTVDALGRVLVVNWRAANGGLWRYDGSQWSKLRDDPYLADVAVDPRNPSRIGAVSDDLPYHDESFATGVWLTDDDGATWHQQNEGLGMLRVECIAVCPHDPDLWVVGTCGRGFYAGRWGAFAWRNASDTTAPSWRLLGPVQALATIESSSDLRSWTNLIRQEIPPHGLLFQPTVSNLPPTFFRASITN